MVAGLTNSEIARATGPVSAQAPSSITSAAVLAKLGATSRVEAAEAARRLGVVGAEI